MTSWNEHPVVKNLFIFCAFEVQMVYPQIVDGIEHLLIEFLRDCTCTNQGQIEKKLTSIMQWKLILIEKIMQYLNFTNLGRASEASEAFILFNQASATNSTQSCSQKSYFQIFSCKIFAIKSHQNLINVNKFEFPAKTSNSTDMV